MKNPNNLIGFDNPLANVKITNELLSKREIINLVQDAFGGISLSELESLIGLQKGNLQEMLSSEKDFDYRFLQRLKLFLEYSSEAQGDIINDFSPVKKAFDAIRTYESLLFDYIFAENKLEIRLIEELCKYVSLERYKETGNLRYVGQDEMLDILELRDIISNYNDFLISKRALRKNEINAIFKALTNHLDQYFYEAQLALSEYDTIIGSNVREQGYPEGWWDPRTMAEMVVELYEIQLGLDGDTGEPIKLGDLFKSLIERHHIDYDKAKSALQALILLSKNSHKEIDHLHKNLDDYTRLRSARDSFEQGLPPPYWNLEAKERYLKIQEKVRVKGVENVLYGGMTKQEMIHLLTTKFLGV